MKQNNRKTLIVWLSIGYIMIIAVCLVFSTQYIKNKLLVSNEHIAIDVAELVKNNFQITDAEVAHMKSLTFTEMETDPINLRLMNVGNGADLHTHINNIYLVAPLKKDEIKYVTDESNAENFECTPGTPLDAIWLLNGRIDDGKFVPTVRDDIYRYTDTYEELNRGFTEKKNFGTYSRDEWGEFITGYVPIYTVEGNYVGMLGIDMDPDSYQKNVFGVVFALTIAFGASAIALTGLFLFFYFKYMKAQEQRIYFDFYSRMSHDMRTPMNGILGITQLAEGEEDQSVLHDYFHKIGESGEYLLRLINDTLDVSKISSGKMTLHLEAVSYDEMMSNIVDMVKMSALKQEIYFVVEKHGFVEDYLVQVDLIRMKQIFMNLLSNALKYTQPGGTVTFEQRCVQINEKTISCQFVIKDTGVGMSEEYIHKSLFHPFAQEHNELSDKYTGSGLGLTIVKSLVTLMGGTISLESKLGAGSTFTIKLELPRIDSDVKQQIMDERMSEEDISKALQGKHILICEDHPLNAEIAKKLLEKQGCLIDIAENGQIGIEMFEQSMIGYYQAILMDIRMPVMNGLDATRHIRLLERKDAQTISIIAMTANAYAEDVEHSRNSGMNAHLSKPIEPKVLYETLAKLIG